MSNSKAPCESRRSETLRKRYTSMDPSTGINLFVFFACVTLLANMAHGSEPHEPKTSAPVYTQQQVWIPSHLRSKYSPCNSPERAVNFQRFEL